MVQRPAICWAGAAEGDARNVAPLVGSLGRAVGPVSNRVDKWRGVSDEGRVELCCQPVARFVGEPPCSGGEFRSPCRGPCPEFEPDPGAPNPDPVMGAGPPPFVPPDAGVMDVTTHPSKVYPSTQVSEHPEQVTVTSAHPTPGPGVMTLTVFESMATIAVAGT